MSDDYIYNRWRWTKIEFPQPYRVGDIIPKYRLEHIKTFSAGAYKADGTGFFGRTREKVMWDDMSKQLKCSTHIAVAFFKDGTTETIGGINSAGGICDDCSITFEEVRKIELFKLVH